MKYKTTVEEVEDESVVAARMKAKSTTHLMIHESELHGEERPQQSKHATPSKIPVRQALCVEIEDEFWEEHRLHPQSTAHILAGAMDTEPDDDVRSTESTTPVEANSSTMTHEIQLPPPPRELKPIRMPKKRFYPTGESSVGVSVLSVKGWVGNLNNAMTDLRLDSCADITLISSEYYDTLKAAPNIQQGMRMKLWQLTDKDSTLRGFVRIPIFMETDDGVILESEAEAYVVPGMTIPILLGEDYQLTYEVGVTRNVEEGPRVHFGRSEWGLKVQQVERTKDFERMRQSAHSAGSSVRNFIAIGRTKDTGRKRNLAKTNELSVRRRITVFVPMNASPYKSKGNWERTKTG